jgi:hypothetical protein
MMKIAPAVAEAAQESGVAQRPIADLDAYRDHLQTFVYASGTTMKPIFMVPETGSKKARGLLPRARKSACCAQRRLWSMKKSPAPP